MKRILCLLATVVLAVSNSFGAKTEPVPSAKLSDFKIGPAVTGPAVDLSNTGGKAVVIEAWGVHCGPCLASLPHIEKLAGRNKSDTIFVGAECQGSSDAEVKEIVKKNKLSYAIVKGVSGPVNFRGIPHAFVFDTAGSLIFSGSPFDGEFEKAVRKAGRPLAAK